MALGLAARQRQPPSSLETILTTTWSMPSKMHRQYPQVTLACHTIPLNNPEEHIHQGTELRRLLSVMTLG